MEGSPADAWLKRSGTGHAWSRDETMACFALYIMLTDRQRNDKANPETLRLARALRRGPGSVYMKLMNLRSHDPNAMARGAKGLRHGSKYELEMWQRYLQEGDAFLLQALRMLVLFETREQGSDRKGGHRKDGQYLNGEKRLPERRDMNKDLDIELEDDDNWGSNGGIVSNCTTVESVTLTLIAAEQQRIGAERVTMIMARVNQEYFRNALITNYHDSCCLTGIRLNPLLMASHIKPWKASTGFEKTNAANGLLLNALHDKAFDRGLLTIDDDYRVHVSSTVPHNPPNDQWLFRYEGERIAIPAINPPSHEFIEYHNTHVFVSA